MPKHTSSFILLFLSSLILLSLLPGCLPSAPEPITGTIYGYVALPDDTAKDLTGYSPIPGATVIIVDADGVTHTVITDENGYYCFNNIIVKTNTIINITKDTEGGGKLIFKDVVPLAVSPEEDYDAGIADTASTATALVVEELVNLGQVQEDIDLDEITSSDGFDELKEDIQQAQEDNQDINIDNSIITQLEEIADNIVNPPAPTPTPTPAPTPIDTEAIPGVTAPVTGATPVSTITETAQYTGTVTWTPTDNPFAGETVYTATITLTAKTGFTLTGVAENFFTVAGVTTDTNAADSGIVTAVFPETAAVAVGESYGGGIVAYIFQDNGIDPDDPGYVEGEQHGLIASAADQSDGIYWHATNTGTTGATATALGTGEENTDKIIALYGAETNAARVCYDYINDDTGTGVYSDWYLPSKDELNKLWINKDTVGGFDDSDYRSSSEISAAQAWYQSFVGGDQNQGNKAFPARVRAVRDF